MIVGIKLKLTATMGEPPLQGVFDDDIANIIIFGCKAGDYKLSPGTLIFGKDGYLFCQSAEMLITFEFLHHMQYALPKLTITVNLSLS